MTDIRDYPTPLLREFSDRYDLGQLFDNPKSSWCGVVFRFCGGRGGGVMRKRSGRQELVFAAWHISMAVGVI